MMTREEKRAAAKAAAVTIAETVRRYDAEQAAKPEGATSLQVRWTYYDQFEQARWGQSPSFTTRTEAAAFIDEKFAEVEPEAWWIEEVTTIEYHNRTDEDGAKADARLVTAEETNARLRADGWI